MTDETPPLCPSNHGLMVPCETMFAYLGCDGRTVTATVTWHADTPGIEATVYALLPDGVPADLPQIGSNTIGEQIQFLRDEGRLVEFAGDMAKMYDLFRVDDQRPNQKHSYMIWYGSTSRRGPSLKPGAVYGYFQNGHRDPEQKADFPLSLSFEELSALMAEQGIQAIARLEDIGLTKGTIKMPKHNKVVVWDVGAMMRR